MKKKRTVQQLQLEHIEKAFIRADRKLAGVSVARFLRRKSMPPLDVKLRMAAIVLRIMQHRKKFGLFVILGWRQKWDDYADTPDISQDLFAQRKLNIMRPVVLIQKRKRPATISRGNRRGDNITRTVNFDGAILVDTQGNVLHSGTMIEGLRPRAAAHKLNPHRTPDLSSQFGFRRKVHMRHITAITSSHEFSGTTVFTVSEETDDLHIFEGGRIVYSTVRGEMAK